MAVVLGPQKSRLPPLIRDVPPTYIGRLRYFCAIVRGKPFQFIEPFPNSTKKGNAKKTVPLCCATFVTSPATQTEHFTRCATPLRPSWLRPRSTDADCHHILRLGFWSTTSIERHIQSLAPGHAPRCFLRSSRYLFSLCQLASNYLLFRVHRDLGGTVLHLYSQ